MSRERGGDIKEDADGISTTDLATGSTLVAFSRAILMDRLKALLACVQERTRRELGGSKSMLSC